MKKTTKGNDKTRADKAVCETIGIDLGDKISRYAVLSQTGEVAEEGSFRNTAASIRKHFGGPPAQVAIEVGAQSAWIAEELKQLGHQVTVANARELRWITASDRKNDRNDAVKLARLARSDEKLLTPVTHRSSQQQAELNVIRARDALVRARTLLVNAARSLAKGFGHRLPATITPTFGSRALAQLPDILRPSLTNLCRQIDSISRRVKQLEVRIAALADKRGEVKRLVTIPGVGALTALTFVLTLGDAGRFRRSRDVGSYLGLRPKQRQSGERDPDLGISKGGDKYLRKLLVQCAHHILGLYGTDSALRRWGLGKAESGKSATKRAVVAVARKLAVLMHRLWRTGEVFRAFPAAA